MKRVFVAILTAVLCISGGVFAACPSADLTGDCRVNLADLAIVAEQWLDEGSYTLHVNSSVTLGVSIASSTGHGGSTNYTLMPTVGTSVTLTAPATVNDTTFTGWTGDVNSTDQTVSFVMNTDKTVTAKYILTTTPNMVWVDINDPGVSGHEGFIGEISRYETTNAQYCQYLNAANATGDITVSSNYVVGATGSNAGQDFVGQNYYDLAGPGFSYNGATNGGEARITWTGSSFTVDAGYENHPITHVSWYGSTAFADYYGLRLPTEWEWQAVADYNGSYAYGHGTGTITNSLANYYNSNHPNGTTAVGAYGLMHGYGMADMAGNVWEWTDSIYSGSDRVIRGGSWGSDHSDCTVSDRHGYNPFGTNSTVGFRVCR